MVWLARMLDGPKLFLGKNNLDYINFLQKNLLMIIKIPMKLSKFKNKCQTF